MTHKNDRWPFPPGRRRLLLHFRISSGPKESVFWRQDFYNLSNNVGAHFLGGKRDPARRAYSAPYRRTSVYRCESDVDKINKIGEPKKSSYMKRNSKTTASRPLQHTNPCYSSEGSDASFTFLSNFKLRLRRRERRIQTCIYLQFHLKHLLFSI